MSDMFYRAFEEKYRGSRELIKSRLQVYLPFLRPLLKFYPVGKALDVGCGRGEWLDLMGELGFDACGVDLDDGMLEACRERNLNVENADAISYLKGLPDSSLCIVSGFHLAEHLPFEVLQHLVQEALRVLVPGGLLILETPNPENIVVGASSFYLDPTHQRPIPPELLSFLPEHYGFGRWKILRLQENPDLRRLKNIELIHVLKGVSPDYAVVAQKSGSDELKKLMQEAFEKEYGLTLDTIASQFQLDLNGKNDQRVQLQQTLEIAQASQAQVQRLSQQLEQTEEKAHEKEREVKAQLQQALDVAQASQAQLLSVQEQLLSFKGIEVGHLQQIRTLNDELENVRNELHAVHQANHSHWTQLKQTKQELHTIHQSNHHHWQLAEQRQAQVNALLNSTSWRVTEPLRWAVHQFRLLRTNGFKPRVKAVAKKVLRKVVSWIIFRPKIKRIATQAAYKLDIAERLKPFVRSLLVVHQAPDIQKTLQQVQPDLQVLTPRARKIYHDLKLAIEKVQRGGA